MGSRGLPMGDLGQRSDTVQDTECSDTEENFVPIYEDHPDLKVIPFEDFQNAITSLSRSYSITSRLRAQREELAQKLESLLQVHKLSLHRIDELEAMKRKLKSRDLALENANVSLQEKSEDLAIAKDRFLSSARSLLIGAKALAVSRSQLEDACRKLDSEHGKGKLLQLQNMINARRRSMVAQIATLYPIMQQTTKKMSQCADPLNKDSQNVERMDRMDDAAMTIAGLHVVTPLNTKPGLYNEPTDHEASATALGYVAHALSLLASCLDVPLRYPIRLGASRSYIQDNAPAVELNLNEAGSNGTLSNFGGNRKAVMEFPLFSEGQDTTRSAYAVFLLNKDLEQVLNYLGAESVGPRHILPNLKKIFELVIFGIGAPV